MIFAFLYGDKPLSYFIYTLFTLVAVVIGLTLHEVAHGLAAKWNGDYTAKYAGRLTLNPVKHFDLVGFLMMMMVGFGYAKPVPVNPSNYRHYRKGLITVAIAGIVMNVIVAFITTLFGCLFFFGMTKMSTEAGYEAMFYIGELFRIIARVNLSLAFFNLLPIYPLDGFRLVESLTHRGNKFCAFMRTNGMYLLWGLVALSVVVDMAGIYARNLPFWFDYFDILGTYINICVNSVTWVFTSFWSLFIPGYRPMLLMFYIYLYGGIV